MLLKDYNEYEGTTLELSEGKTKTRMVWDGGGLI